MNNIVLLFSIAMNNIVTGMRGWYTTQHTQPSDIQHNGTHNTAQQNTTTTPPLLVFTYKTMAEVLGAVASAVAVVEAAGKVWSTGWKYYQVRISQKNLSHNW